MVDNEHTVITSRIEIIGKDRVRQGDILKCNEWAYGDKIYDFPYIYILSQDCDLSQDYKYSIEDKEDDDKVLEAILVCPLFFLGDFVQGTHVKYKKEGDSEFTVKNMKPKTKREKEKIQKDELERYFYINEYKNERGIVVPELVMDFKFFMTIPRDNIYTLYKENYICSVSEIFRENISRRFANFLSRIGLPEIKEEI